MPRGKGKRHNAEQIVRILREEEGGKTIAQVSGEYNISEQNFYRWRRKYGEMDQSDVLKYQELEEENRRL